MTTEIIVGISLIIFALLFYPFYKYVISKVQMMGWLAILKKQFNKEEEKTDVKKEK